jgi:hypothetical protein
MGSVHFRTQTWSWTPPASHRAARRVDVQCRRPNRPRSRHCAAAFVLIRRSAARRSHRASAPGDRPPATRPPDPA